MKTITLITRLGAYALFIVVMVLTSCKEDKKSGSKTDLSNNKIDSHYIDQLIEQYHGTDNDPGLALMVIKNEEVIFQRTIGIDNIETGNTISSKSNFRIGSITKQMTALSVLMLADKKKIDLDEPLTIYFPEFPSHMDSITIRMLIYHTSGLMDYQTQTHNVQPERLERLLSGQEQLVEKDVIDLIKKTDSTYFKPGTEFRYSNTGYILLGELVKRTSKMSFKDFMKRNIFKPLGMDNTLVYTNEDFEIPERVLGHSRIESGWEVTDQNYSSALMGDGGIYSNLEDLQKWSMFLSGKKKLKLSRKSFNKYLLPGSWSNGSDLKLLNTANPEISNPNPLLSSHSYGFGWEIGNYNGKDYIFHGGASIGFRHMLLFQPSKELFIVLLTNRNKASRELIEPIFKYFFETAE